MSLRLDTFDGAGTPVQAADWLRYMERQFGALEMTSVQKARFVAFQLKGLLPIIISHSWYKTYQIVESGLKL